MVETSRSVRTAVSALIALSMLTGLLVIAPEGAEAVELDALIKGKVTDGVDPVPDSYVKAMLMFSGDAQMGYDFTDENGDYEIAVPGGIDYMVFVGNGSYYMSMTTVRVMSGETAWANFTLTSVEPEVADVTLKGFVKDAMASPVTDGHVLGAIFESSDSDVPYYANITTPDPVTGYFEVNVIPGAAGGGVFAMDFEGYPTIIMNATDEALSSGNSYWLNITMTTSAHLEDATVYGYVTDDGTGLPIENALVTIECWNPWLEDGGYSNYTFTDSDGYYEMAVANNTDGGSRLMVLKGGYAMKMFEDLVIGSGDSVQRDAALVAADSTVRGTVMDLKYDAPVEFANVFMYDLDWNLAMAVTDSSGAYEIMFPAGTGIYISAEAEGYSAGSAFIDLAPGEELVQDFGLWPAESYIEGYVTDALTTSYLEGAWVEVESDNFWEEAETDGSGYYSIQVVFGSYEVRVNADGYRTNVSFLEVADEATVTHDVGLLPWDLPESCNLFGWVNDTDSGTGISGAHVRVQLPDGTYFKETWTDPEGRYEMDIPPVELLYGVTAYGHFPEFSSLDAFGLTELRMDVGLAPDPEGPIVDYTQDPVDNITQSRPSVIDVQIDDDNLQEFVLIQYMYWKAEDTSESYYMIDFGRTSFDPLSPSDSQEYTTLNGYHLIHEEFNGTASGGWLTDDSTEWYVPATEVMEGPMHVYGVSGQYTDSHWTDAPGALFFDADTGEVVFVWLEWSWEPVYPSDPDAVFDPMVMSATFDAVLGTPLTHPEFVGMGGMLVSDMSFSYDPTVPSGKYRTAFSTSDFGGRYFSIHVNMTVDNDPPVANAGPDLEPVVDTLATLDGSDSGDNVGIVSYVWDFEEDGTPVQLEGEVASYTFTDVGLYVITLTVTDGAGHEDTDTVVVDVLPDAAPVADAGPDQEVDEGSTVVFDGSGSTDDLVDITNYTWTIVELEVDMFGEAPEYTFTVPGVYTVELVVRDSLDQESEPDSMTVTVLDVTPPVADAGDDPVGVLEGDEVTFNGSGSSDNVGIVEYRWTFDDGGPVTLSGAEVEYIFMDAGEYEVTLTVTDEAGLSDTDTVTVRVESANEPPVADAGDDMTAKAGNTVEFDGTGSSDDSVTFTWTFEYDGETVTLTGSQVEYVFDIAGTYIVTLNVTDEEGLWDTDDVVVIVEDKATAFLTDYWWLFAALAAVAVIAALLVLMKGGKGSKPSSPGSDSGEEFDEEDLPPPDDEDL